MSTPSISAPDERGDQGKAPNEAPKEAPSETPKETSGETSKEAPNETPNEVPKETLSEAKHIEPGQVDAQTEKPGAQPGKVDAQAAGDAFAAFATTIARLRAPDGCPWDREQTHESIASNMVEEAYEAVDTIECGDLTHLREELGDVLLQVVLQSQIAADAGEFTIEEVCRDIDAKIIRRHPHVFGSAEAENARAVLELWDSVKLAEKDAADARAEAQGQARESLLDGVPKSFPALMQAQKISRKAVAAGFEWDSLDDVWDKVSEEFEELRNAFDCAPKTDRGKIDPSALDEVSLEFGDVLFTLVNVARKLGIDSETALRQSCNKFRRRWSEVEQSAWDKGQAVEELSMDEMQAAWERAKSHEHKHEHDAE